jgi:hypothetical protein
MKDENDLINFIAEKRREGKMSSSAEKDRRMRIAIIISRLLVEAG